MIKYCILIPQIKQKFIENKMLIESFSNTKNNLGIFQRRTALNVTSKSIKQWKQSINQEKFKKVKNQKQTDQHIQFFAKFQEQAFKKTSDQTEKPVDLLKKEKKFQKILNNIEPRGGSFYRFGFKSYEKANKKLFAEVLNVVPSKMKGTIHIGQMWSTAETSKFIRENKIFINKLKLMDKLKHAKNQQQKDLVESTTSLYPPNQSKNSFGSKYKISQPNTQCRLSVNEISNNSFKQLNRSMDQIHKQLNNLKPFCSTERNLGKLKQMESCIEKINKIDSSYHEQIGEWI